MALGLNLFLSVLSFLLYYKLKIFYLILFQVLRVLTKVAMGFYMASLYIVTL